MFFLLGPSGCGKTTLLRMIAGFVEPSAGTIQFGDPPAARDVTFTPPNKRHTGMVFQSYALWPHMTVYANVAFGLTVRGLSQAEEKRRVGEALQLVQMEQYASRKPNQLSGGQQQRVALARALVVRPEVLLLDEPLSNLDAKLRTELRTEIRRICKLSQSDNNGPGSPMTAVYVTHDQKEALSMADRIAVMSAGKVLQVGPPSELYRRPESSFVAEFLGETNFLEGTVLDLDEPLGRATIRTAAGDIKTLKRGVLSRGELVICAVRPEAVALLSPSEIQIKTGNQIAGTWKESSYFGDSQLVVIEIGGGSELRALQNHPSGTEVPGSSVTLLIQPEDITVLAR
jgi:iron(III) transport system ATP-binding protein